MSANSRDAVVVGAGGTGRDVLDALPSSLRVLGFLDDLQTGPIEGLPVLGRLEDASSYNALLVDALGNPRTFRDRPRLIGRTGVPAEQFLGVIHPRAVVSQRAVIGEGSLIYPGAIVGPGVRLGLHVQVLANAVINHDAEIGDWTIIASGVNLSGSVRIGRRCYVGTGASIIQKCSVGDEALIGIGAVVLKAVKPGATVAGNPARVLRS